ncbi:MAG: pilus assembly protein [Myxococcota bacterium]|nr:pilus assembly protein [Myxococcota bacterium]
MGRLTRDTRGAAYVEFLISFIPVFLMFLGMVQMGLMYAGGLAVQRAASTAARAAIVVLDDDPQYYGDEARMQVGGGGGAGEGAESGLLGFLSGVGVSGDAGGAGAIFGGSDDESSARMDAIRSAASMPLLAMAPPPGIMVTSARNESVMGAIGTIPAGRAAFGLLYNQGALAVRLVDGPSSATDQTTFSAVPLHAEGAIPTPARVRVTYLFHCAVPLANRLMCNDPLFVALGADGAAAARLAMGGTPSLATIQAIADQRAIEASREARDELGWDDLPGTARVAIIALGVAGMQARVKVISAEAQLPIQYANYRYQSEGGS